MLFHNYFLKPSEKPQNYPLSPTLKKRVFLFLPATASHPIGQKPSCRLQGASRRVRNLPVACRTPADVSETFPSLAGRHLTCRKPCCTVAGRHPTCQEPCCTVAGHHPTHREPSCRSQDAIRRVGNLVARMQHIEYQYFI